MYNDHDNNKDNQIRPRKMNMQQRTLQSSVSADMSKQQMVSIQIPSNRRNEIKEYLKLFGYKSEKNYTTSAYNWLF